MFEITQIKTTRGQHVNTFQYTFFFWRHSKSTINVKYITTLIIPLSFVLRTRNRIMFNRFAQINFDYTEVTPPPSIETL